MQWVGGFYIGMRVNEIEFPQQQLRLLQAGCGVTTPMLSKVT